MFFRQERQPVAGWVKRHPIITSLVLTAVLVAEALSFGEDDHHMGLLNLGSKPRSYWHGHPQAAVVRENDRLKLYDSNREEYDQIALLASVRTNSRPDTYGFCGPAISVRRHSMLVEPYKDATLAPGDLALIRSEYADFMVNRWAQLRRSKPSRNMQVHASLLAKGDGVTWSVNPLWLLHDLLLVGACVVWFRATVNAAHHVLFGWPQRHRAQAGLCTKCKYDLRSVIERGIIVCPECGRAIDQRNLRAGKLLVASHEGTAR